MAINKNDMNFLEDFIDSMTDDETTEFNEIKKLKKEIKRMRNLVDTSLFDKKTLINEYDCESSKHSKSTWRDALKTFYHPGNVSAGLHRNCENLIEKLLPCGEDMYKSVDLDD